MIVTLLIFISLLILFILIGNVVHPHKTAPAEDVFHLNTRQREIDLEVLSLLLSRDENEYLRRSLPEEEFRRVRRERLSLARKYLRAIDDSTGQFIRAAEAVKSSSDSDLAKAAQELLSIAVRVRLNVPIVKMCLTAECLFPSVSSIAIRRVNRYREVGGKIDVMFQRLQSDVPPRMSAG